MLLSDCHSENNNGNDEATLEWERGGRLVGRGYLNAIGVPNEEQREVPCLRRMSTDIGCQAIDVKLDPNHLIRGFLRGARVAHPAER